MQMKGFPVPAEAAVLIYPEDQLILLWRLHMHKLNGICFHAQRNQLYTIYIIQAMFHL